MTWISHLFPLCGLAFKKSTDPKNVRKLTEEVITNEYKNYIIHSIVQYAKTNFHY